MEEFRMVAGAARDILDDGFERALACRLQDPIVLGRLLVGRLNQIQSPCAGIQAVQLMANSLLRSLTTLQALGDLPPDP